MGLAPNRKFGNRMRSPLRISGPRVDTGMFPNDHHNNMKTNLSLSNPAALESEALVAVVLDHAEPSGEKQQKKPETATQESRPPTRPCSPWPPTCSRSGEVTGKPFEINLLHKPAGLKAKRLLLISGGSAKKFTSYDLRRLAGAAVRALKSRGIRSFAFIAPPGIAADEAVRAIIEGASRRKLRS